MSMTDPTVVTISAVAQSCPRISVGDDRSEYQTGDGLVTLTFSSLYDQGRQKRTKRMARIDVRKIAADPMKPVENVEVSMAYYIAFDLPRAGFTAVEAKAVADGFNTALQASSGAMIAKLLGGES